MAWQGDFTMNIADLFKRWTTGLGVTAKYDRVRLAAAIPATLLPTPAPAIPAEGAAPAFDAMDTGSAPGLEGDMAASDAIVQPERPLHSGPERRVEAMRLNARSGTRVLVIDDSATIVALLGRMLRQNGYTTIEAFDAESGIEIAFRERPDLVFLDIVLPGMDGFSALRQLRRDPRTMAMPIIMISGNAQATEQFYVQRIGADDFMKKPFSRAEVFARIERLLAGHRVEPQLVPKDFECKQLHQESERYLLLFLLPGLFLLLSQDCVPLGNAAICKLNIRQF